MKKSITKKILAATMVFAVLGSALVSLLIFNSRAAVTPQVLEQADIILSSQHPSGAIAMTPQFYPNDPAASPIWVNPYFANYSAIALLDIYKATGDIKYKNAVTNYIRWYLMNLNQDGTINDFGGTWNKMTSNGSYDSSDSYAATFLMLVDKYRLQAGGSSFIKSNLSIIKKVFMGMELTLDESDGLTKAKPTYPVKFLMDNNEVRIGYLSALNLAKAYRTTDQNFNPTYLTNRSNNIGASLKKFYNASESAYNWAKQSSVYSNYDSSDWGVSGKANALMLSMALSPTDSRSTALLEKIKSDFYINKDTTDFREYFFLMTALTKFGKFSEAAELSSKYYQNLNDTNLGYTYNHHRAFYIIDKFQTYNNNIFKNRLLNIY